MPRELIEITFGNAITQAKQLEACADDMERVAKAGLAEIKSGLTAAWEGDEANLYYAKLDEVAAHILKTAQKIRKIAQTLRHVAQVFMQTEMKALEIAQQRTYDS